MKCLRTSYNTVGNAHRNGKEPFRANCASKGFKYDSAFDAFIPVKPFASWKLNYSTFTWEEPTPKPDYEKGFTHLWSEDNQEWIKVAIDTE